MNFQSILRHWFTALFFSACSFLVGYLTLSADDAKTLTDAFGKLVEPMIVIVALLATAVARLLMTKANNLFRRGAGEVDGKDSAGGLSPCLVGLGMAAAVMGSLPSCSSDYPITGSISYRDPHSGAKAGLSYSPRQKLRGAITVPIYDAQTGEQLGVTDVVIGEK